MTLTAVPASCCSCVAGVAYELSLTVSRALYELVEKIKNCAIFLFETILAQIWGAEPAPSVSSAPIAPPAAPQSTPIAGTSPSAFEKDKAFLRRLLGSENDLAEKLSDPEQSRVFIARRFIVPI